MDCAEQRSRSAGGLWLGRRRRGGKLPLSPSLSAAVAGGRGDDEEESQVQRGIRAAEETNRCGMEKKEKQRAGGVRMYYLPPVVWCVWCG